MTEPSQYFKGRTVQEQMDEVIGYVDKRAEEVATAAIASDVAQVHRDMLDADADATAAAASAAAAAGTLANAVKKTGEASQSIAGNIAVAGDLTGGTVTVPAPVNNTDAASKKYVDDHDALDVKITNINNYAVGLTGNQNVDGIKTFKLPITIDRNDKAFQWMYLMTGMKKLELPTSTQNHAIQVRNSDGTERIGLHFDVDTNGVMYVYVSGNATDGATSVGFNQRIMTISSNGTVTPGW